MADGVPTFRQYNFELAQMAEDYKVTMAATLNDLKEKGELNPEKIKSVVNEIFEKFKMEIEDEFFEKKYQEVPRFAELKNKFFIETKNDFEQLAEVIIKKPL